jgi:hypothetical protein
VSKPSTATPQRTKAPHAPSHASHGPIQLKHAAAGPSHPPASSLSPRTPPHAYSSLLPHSGSPDSSQSAFLGSLQSAYGNNFVQQVIQRKCHCGGSCRKCSGDDPSVQRKIGDTATPAAGLAAGPVPRGSAGAPLPTAVRAKMEQRFGQNFADVRIHDDPLAQQSASSLNALAYTSGHDIYFAPGQYKPFSEEGERLLAHELTHVIQQRTGQVTSASTKLSSGSSSDAFELEADRASHAVASGAPVSLSSSAGAPSLQRQSAGAAPNIVKASKPFVIPGEKLGSGNDRSKVLALYKQRAASGQLRDLHPGRVESTAWPEWNRGRPKEFQDKLGSLREDCSPDHVVELQVGGADDVSNLRLLGRERNSKAGTRIWNEQIRPFKQPGTVLVFTDVDAEPAMGNDKCLAKDIPQWSGDPMRRKGERIVSFKVKGTNVSLGITENGTIIRADRYAISGFELSKITIDEDDGDNVVIGHIDGVISVAVKEFLKTRSQSKIAINIAKGVASLDTANKNIALLFPFLSEANFTADIDEQGFVGQATFHPSLPIIRAAEVMVKVEHGKFSGGMKVSAGQVQIPIPGVAVTDCSLEATLIEEKFSAQGNLAFKISTFAEAKLTANVDSGGFAAKGVLDLHVPGLDKAQGTITYSNKKLTGDIEIGKDKFKLPRVKSASLHIHVTDTELTGTGVVELDVPGVKRGTLGITVDKAGNYLITGALSLSIPGLKTAEVSLTYAAGDLSGDATIGLDIPGLEGAGAAFKVHYAKGELSGSGQLSYKKGRLSGSIHAALSEKHKLSGGGELSYEIVPGLVATVGIELLENGKTHVSGQLKIPDTINLFAENKIEKTIFSLGVQIPIFAIPLGTRSVGLVADIGADLKARAGIGPGQIRKLQVKASFDPGGDDSNFQFSGGGELYVPAYAELALAVHGGIGLSLAIASATGGIELVGALGLRGALIAGAQISYQNKQFTVDASAELSAEPVLKFSINAYVKVEVILIGEVYRKDWVLASKEWGSGLKVGLRFPVHYEFGKPFHIGLDQVEFIAPTIDYKKAVKDLLPM